MKRPVILNAYRLPAGGREKLWESIHPVNTFRVIFNHYFDADLKPLEERSYYGRAKHIYRHTEVTGMIGDEADRGRFEVLRGMDYYPEGSAAVEVPTVH